MNGYIPQTVAEQQALLSAIGVSSVETLLEGIPKGVRLQRPLDLPDGLSEATTMRALSALAAQNRGQRPLFRGAGAYRHFIPAIIPALLSRGELLTAYTPYQPEMSQGMLQAIFEYQTLIARLTGMDASNASVYDGATAACEAMLMARDSVRKDKILVSQTLPPEVIATLSTYAPCAGMTLLMVPEKDGETDLSFVEANAAGAAGLIAASPNYYGIIEDVSAQATAIHAARGLMIAYCNPIALGILKNPGELGADIAVGEGQPMGIPLSFGGPYLGFMGAKSRYLRNLPGRIVGETLDPEGNRAYVLTLQAREQHIRRDKATSNICSNQSLCALSAAVYLTAMGPQGLYEVADACVQWAGRLKDTLTALPGVKRAHSKPFFHEFVLETERNAYELDEHLRAHGIVGGLPLSPHQTLWCATEMTTQPEIDALVNAWEVSA